MTKILHFWNAQHSSNKLIKAQYFLWKVKAMLKQMRKLNKISRRMKA